MLFFLPRIAVVELFGTIGGGLRSYEYVTLLGSLALNPRVRAVVVDIDSPGGLATASYHAYMALSRVAAQKPVVAFVRGMGASGAYLVSCAASKVVAMPSSLVGSIGVISLQPILADLLDRLGVKMNVTKSGRLKDMGAFYREHTQEEREKQQEMSDEFYEDFLAVVAQARGLEKEAVRRLATGEVFSARRAREMGLVDELGDLDRAIDLAAELGRVPRRVERLRPRRTLMQRVTGQLGTALAEALISEIELRISSAPRL